MKAFPLLLAALLAALSAARADVTLPALISDHAVLQRSDKTALWGKAAPGEKVTASLAGVSGEATAGADGKWRIELNLSRVEAGPFDLTITAGNPTVIHDVVVGEVWVASGQSNMEFTLSQAIGGKEEAAAPANPQLRQFRVPTSASAVPRDECTGTWSVAGPGASGSFTAVGYFFAKELQQTLHAPVGLISSYWGGTPIEAWTSAEALDGDPALRSARQRIGKEVADFEAAKAAYLAAYHDWEKKYTRADRPTADPAAFAAPEIATTDWKPVTLPGKFADAGLPDAGAVWLRKTIPLHGAATESSQQLDLSGLDGFESVYYNGRKIGGTAPESASGRDAPKHYYPPGGLDGDNVIAIRIYRPAGHAGIFSGEPNHFTLGPTALKGEWLARVEYELPALPDEAKTSEPKQPKSIIAASNRPTTLYNGMIEPLLAYTIQGVVWYQGESNAGRAFQYRTAFPLMIADWRRRWGREFPFYFCQLAGYMAKTPEPVESAWAELREAQTRTLALEKTGEAILIDLGESGDIHPRNKKDAGLRLASVALAGTYGRNVPCTGPVYASQKIEGDKVRVTFRGVSGGLVARPLPAQYVVSSSGDRTLPLTRNRPDSPLEGFAICGEDHRWVWADARIEGDSVLVSNPAVTQPVAVRYGWANNPTVNLYDQAGFPAGPFRTDAFPGSTEKAGL